MKVNIEIDCSPEEARRFMGLPDVEKANAVYVDAFAKAMQSAGSVDKMQEYAQQLAPMGQMGLKMFQSFVEGTRKALMLELTTVPLLIIDDLGMRKLPHTAAEDLLEVIMRRYERASTLLTSNRPVDDWGKLLGDTAAVTALLDRLLHHAHVLKCGPKSWRTKVHTDLRTEELTK